MLPQTPKLSIVVPCYNEAAGLAQAYRRITAAAQSLVGNAFELVLVNDGSRDATWEIIKELSAQDGHVVGYSLSRNFGQETAVTCGLHHSRGDRVLLIDADLQDPPELLATMMAKMDEGYDVVYGQRRKRDKETRTKLLTAALFYRLFRYLSGNLNVPLDTGDFRLMSRRVVDSFKEMRENQRFNRGLISWIGYKQTGVPYDRQPRFAGETNMTMEKMIRLAIDAVTGFSIVPLRFATHLGLLALVISAMLTLYTVLSWLSGHAILGWTSLMAAIVFFGSMQLFVLGIIGEYVGRVLIEAKGRPLYFIDDMARRVDSIGRQYADKPVYLVEKMAKGDVEEPAQ